jgi:hypothetical protein
MFFTLYKIAKLIFPKYPKPPILNIIYREKIT